MYVLLGSMADQNLRDVLHTTSRLRQQLLEAVDRLENRGRDHPIPAAAQSSSTSGAGSSEIHVTYSFCALKCFIMICDSSTHG